LRLPDTLSLDKLESQLFIVEQGFLVKSVVVIVPSVFTHVSSS
jgi:hypothetical protein